MQFKIAFTLLAVIALTSCTLQKFIFGPTNELLSAICTLVIGFTVSCFIWLPQSLQVWPSGTDWMVSKQIRSNKLGLRETEKQLFAIEIYSVMIYRVIYRAVCNDFIKLFLFFLSCQCLLPCFYLLIPFYSWQTQQLHIEGIAIYLEWTPTYTWLHLMIFTDDFHDLHDSHHGANDHEVSFRTSH